MTEEEQKRKEEVDEPLEQALNEIEAAAADQEVVRLDSEQLQLSGIDYKLIENHQEAFDLDMLENRYTDYLLKYDYIVGDISYEKLRLRGFFEDYRKGVPIDMKISTIEDYLVEYCSFGCPYFVLERMEKAKADPESYFKKKRPNRSGSSRRATKRPTNRKPTNRSPEKRRGQRNTPNKKTNRLEEQKNFRVKRAETSATSRKSKTKKTENTQARRSEGAPFEIRKKKD